MVTVTPVRLQGQVSAIFFFGLVAKTEVPEKNKVTISPPTNHPHTSFLVKDITSTFYLTKNQEHGLCVGGDMFILF